METKPEMSVEDTDSHPVSLCLVHEEAVHMIRIQAHELVLVRLHRVVEVELVQVVLDPQGLRHDGFAVPAGG